MNFTRRDVMGAAAAMGLASAAPIPAFAQQKSKAVLKVIPHADLKILDPIITTGYISRNHGYMIYDTLFAMDETLTPRPQMVDTFELSADKTVWTFRLRDNLFFHDGKPVVAEDCIASLIRWGKRDGMGILLFNVVDRLEATDARTFVMKLKRPYGLVLDSIGKISSNVPFIMPRAVAETPADKPIDSVIGSGPFIFKKEEWVPGSKAIYVRNPNYVSRKEAVSAASGGKIAKAERVEWITIGDPSTAMNALLSGEVDYWEQVPPDLAPLVAKAPGVKVENLDTLGSMGMARFNHLAAPTNNPLVRQAILKAVNQEDYLRAAVGNPDFYRTCYSVYPCGSPYASDSGAGLINTQNVEAARELLKQGGYRGEKIVVMQSTDITVLSAFALVTAEKLKAIGMNVDLQAMDWSTVLTRRNSKENPDKGGWNVFHTWWIGGDCVNPLTNIAFGGTGEKGWIGWAEDAQLETFRKAFADAAEPADLKKAAADVQRRLYEIGAFINLGLFFVPVGYRDNVRGMIKSPVQFFWNMEAVA